MFTGQGSQYPRMGEGLYRSEHVYRSAVDECCAILERHAGFDLKALLYPAVGQEEQAAEQLRDTRYTQPALFVTEYALARLWMSWDIRPRAMIGHSIGEYVAACLAGAMSLQDALILVALRGRLISGLERGSMLAVPLGEQETRPLLGEALSLAAINAPKLCVASGPTAAVDDLEAEPRRRGLEPVRLHTSHAFHSKMMEPALAAFAPYSLDDDHRDSVGMSLFPSGSFHAGVEECFVARPQAEPISDSHPPPVMEPDEVLI